MNLSIPNKVALTPLFFFLVLIFLPVVDNITGALFKLKLMSEGAIGSPSQLARFALFVLVVWLLDLAKYRQPLRTIILITCYLLLVEALVAVVHMDLKAFLSGIVFSIKILFALCCYYYTANWINSDKQRTIYVIEQVINYGTIVALLVLAAYFSGFHIANYKIGIATRGLFISGNGLGIVLGISTIFLVHFNKKLTLIKFMHIMLLIVCTALLGTKASLIFLFFSLCLLTLKLIKQAPVLTITLSALTAVYLFLPLMDVLGSVFENILHKFNSIDNKLTLLLSSRDVFILNAFKQIDLESFNALRILFGGGAFFAYSDHSSGAQVLRKYLENDLFELFFCYGILIATGYITLYGLALKACLAKTNVVIAIALSLVFFHSISMGHVLFNGTSAITYSLCLALAMKGARVTQDDF